ncbi:GntR family transcriptional regulator [Streptomyces sp. AA1529]|uniref:GntR family transcriptional regulator n=1 Tax=unclassified Streptomyces TaxID=2593676 RepID=UPI0002F416AD|nr:GntR family transcriptional regulator [Streptomyces sp. AA1529]
MPAQQRIQRPAPMYMQVAREVAREIESGTYKPGDVLPSEAQMVDAFGVGKATVRQAVAELRAMGLVDVRQGKGSIVRGPALQGHPMDRGIYRRSARSGPRWEVPQPPEVEEPSISRVVLDGTTAALLDQADQDALSVERLLRDPDTDVRTAHRTLIPLSVAAEVPALADAPDAPTAALFEHLAAAGHTLTWAEHVSARIPLPDERATLRLPDASPLLITHRVTYGDQRRPLLCEELRAPAAGVRLVFPVQAAKAPANKPARAKSA